MNRIVETLQARVFEAMGSAIDSAGMGSAALLDIPDHPNVGDHGILLGELAFIDKSLPNAALHIASRNTYSGHLFGKTGQCDVIFINGGGNFGDIWPAHHDFRLRILDRFRDRRIVQFPQSLSFADPERLDDTKRHIAACRDFHLFVRDERSLAFARANFDCPSVLCPDIAFAMGALPARSATTDVSCLFRTDKEVLQSKTRQVSDLLAASKLDFRTGDWLTEAPRLRHIHGILRRLSKRRRTAGAVFRHGRPGFQLYARIRLRAGLAMLSRGNIVVTDRLHGMILSTLLGRPTVVFDSLDGKVKAFHRTWLANLPGSRFIDDVADVARAVEILQATDGVGNAAAPGIPAGQTANEVSRI